MGRARKHTVKGTRHRVQAREARKVPVPLHKGLLKQAISNPRGLAIAAPEPWDQVDVQAFMADAKRLT